MERTSTIRSSLYEVEKTLLIAVALVILVVFVFLRRVRATLIPAAAVPVSIIATFGFMYLAGYSLNNLSLMALIVATGFVVDDAIVVLENATRHIEAGMPPVAAALASAQEVGFTVVSMSLSLIAVFIPILFMGDIVGRLFREFALTLSGAILVSLVVSLTLTPMMCARLLKQQEKSVLHRRSELIFETVRAAYGRSLGWALRHPLLIVALLAAAIGLNVYLYIVIPKGFFPEQDTGRMMGFIRADQTTSFQAMQEKMSQIVRIVRADASVDTVTAVTGGGFGARNSGFMFIALKPLSQRPPVGAVIARLRPQLARVPGANLFLVPVQDVRIGGAQVPLTAVAHYEYTNTPLSVNHQGQFAASTISFNLPEGVSLSGAAAAINETMARIGVPVSIQGSFQGTARSFQTTLARQPWLILAAILAMYIVLGVLYESVVHPLTILSTLPSAGVGALLALLAFNAEFTVIALIGVFLLIGLVKKNAIMMVDFALEAERRGDKRPEQAIFEACLLRFRPIMMTTMAAILGALPLVLRRGDGAGLRH